MPKKAKVKINNNSKVVKLLLLLVFVFLIINVIVKVMSLIITPTDMVIVEKGTVSNEETAIRIYN